VIDVSAFRMLILSVTSWLDRREREVLAHPIEECCGGSWVGDAYGSRMMTAGNLPREPTGLAGTRCTRSRRSSHRTRWHRRLIAQMGLRQDWNTLWRRPTPPGGLDDEFETDTSGKNCAAFQNAPRRNITSGNRPIGPRVYGHHDYGRGFEIPEQNHSFDGGTDEPNAAADFHPIRDTKRPILTAKAEWCRGIRSCAASQ
jgi:hypothetical protein